MYPESIKNLTNLELRTKYVELQEEYRQLEIKHQRTNRLYERAKDKLQRVSNSLNEWAKKYYRLKLTVAAGTDETPCFEQYASSALYKQEEIDRLESMVHDLFIKNNELEEKLVNSEFQQQATSWINKKFGDLRVIARR